MTKSNEYGNSNIDIHLCGGGDVMVVCRRPPNSKTTANLRFQNSKLKWKMGIKTIYFHIKTWDEEKNKKTKNDTVTYPFLFPLIFYPFRVLIVFLFSFSLATVIHKFRQFHEYEDEFFHNALRLLAKCVKLHRSDSGFGRKVWNDVVLCDLHTEYYTDLILGL